MALFKITFSVVFFPLLFSPVGPVIYSLSFGMFFIFIFISKFPVLALIFILEHVVNFLSVLLAVFSLSKLYCYSITIQISTVVFSMLESESNKTFFLSFVVFILKFKIYYCFKYISIILLPVVGFDFSSKAKFIFEKAVVITLLPLSSFAFLFHPKCISMYSSFKVFSYKKTCIFFSIFAKPSRTFFDKSFSLSILFSTKFSHFLYLLFMKIS